MKEIEGEKGREFLTRKNKSKGEASKKDINWVKSGIEGTVILR